MVEDAISIDRPGLGLEGIRDDSIEHPSSER